MVSILYTFFDSPGTQKKPRGCHQIMGNSESIKLSFSKFLLFELLQKGFDHFYPPVHCVLLTHTCTTK